MKLLLFLLASSSIVANVAHGLGPASMEALSRAVANHVERNSASTVARNAVVEETRAPDDDEPQSPSCDITKCLGRTLLFRCCSSKATRDEGSQQWEDERDWSPAVSEFESVPAPLLPFSPTFVRPSMISELPRLRGGEIELPRVGHNAVDDASIAQGRYHWGESI